MDILIKDEDQINIILENISKMLFNRKYVDDQKKAYNSLLEGLNNNKETSCVGTRTYAIKFYYPHIDTIKKIPEIENFLEANKKNYKFLIVKSISNKGYKQLMEYNNLEIFLDNDFMINLVDHHMVPKHYLLTKEEAEEYFKTFDNKKKEMPRILSSDPVARYYNAKVGDVFRVERPSITAGISISFSIVVQGKVDFMRG